MNLDKLKASRKKLADHRTPSYLADEILKGNLIALSQGITLVESTKEEDESKASELIQKIYPKSGKSIRIGITGVPGVGKSTFIESFGMHLIQKGYKVAVLAVDPSSEITKGSILGDKTRMNELSQSENAFIRPTASSGSLGGVARKSRETIFLCEAAGFDVILIETVGVGQSEIEVNSMTDFFLLLMLAGAGDELQGIKRGIMEMADLILINKADGDNVKRANLARQEYENAVHYLPPKRKFWFPKVETSSSVSNDKMDKIISIIDDFKSKCQTNNEFQSNRLKQDIFWFEKSVEKGLIHLMESNKELLKQKELLLDQIQKGELDSFRASDILIQKFKEKYNGI
ncbi:MAG: methylmalonyl Co-A mutase-associated GTPase MeaB [Crocinitomicaceae bacterium]